MVFGRVVLVGDAASTPRPHTGFGVSRAGAPAQALAETLSADDDVDRAVAAYNTMRQPLSERTVSHGRRSVHSSASISRPPKIAGYLNSGAILEWIALPDFLATKP